MMFLWLPFFFLIPLALLWMTRPGHTAMGGVYQVGRQHVTGATGPDPIEIARQRLARGEISTADFEEIRRAISEAA